MLLISFLCPWSSHSYLCFLHELRKCRLWKQCLTEQNRIGENDRQLHNKVNFYSIVEEYVSRVIAAAAETVCLGKQQSLGNTAIISVPTAADDNTSLSSSIISRKLLHLLFSTGSEFQH